MCKECKERVVTILELREIEAAQIKKIQYLNDKVSELEGRLEIALNTRLELQTKYYSLLDDFIDLFRFTTRNENNENN